MKLRNGLVIILLTGAALLAQGPPPGGPLPGGPGFGHGRGGGFGGFDGHFGHHVVTGAPYTAELNSTHTQTLTDGNVIQNTVTGTVARDASGRTYRTETSNGGPLGQTGPVTRISIFDPVAGYMYELNPSTKTGTRRQIHVPPANAQSEHESQTEHPANPNVTRADLGTQAVNGVSAQGKSITRTVPAGAFGNAKPIVSTSEVWYSPALQTVISSKFNDPRAGSTAFALTNVQMSADPSLFQVPAGYTITDAPQGQRGQFHGGPPAAQ